MHYLLLQHRGISLCKITKQKIEQNLGLSTICNTKTFCLVVYNLASTVSNTKAPVGRLKVSHHLSVVHAGTYTTEKTGHGHKNETNRYKWYFFNYETHL